MKRAARQRNVRRGRGLMLGAAVILVALGAWWYGTNRTGEARVSASPAVTLWPDGETYDLDFEWSGRVSGTIAGSDVQGGVDWVGGARATVVQSQGSRAVVLRAFTLDEERSEQQILGAPVSAKDLQTTLADAEVVLWLDQEGQLTDLSFSAAPLAETPLMDLATALAVPIRSDVDWSSKEVIPDGRAETVAHWNDRRVRIRRRTLDDLRIAPFATGTVRPATSDETIEFRENGWRYSGELGFEVEQDVARMRAARSWTITAHATSDSPAGEAPASGVRKSLAAWRAPPSAERLNPPPPHVSREAVLDYVEDYAARIKGAGFSAIFQDMLSKVASDPRLQQRLAERYFELSPSSRKGVIDLLAQCGSPSALDALADVMEDMVARGSLPEQLDALRGALLVDEPSSRFLQRLMSLQQRENIHGQRVAAFGLGSVVHECRARAGCERVADDALEQLLTWAEGQASTGSVESTRYALRALGNAGGERILPVVEPHLDHPAGEVRRAATMALRRVQSDRSRSLLVHMARDPSPAVQQAAFSVLERDVSLDFDVVRDLQARIDREPMHARIAPSAVAILARTRPPGWQQSLQVIIDSDRVDGSTRGRARRILQIAKSEEGTR